MSTDYPEYAFHLPKRSYKVTNLNTYGGMYRKQKRKQKEIDDGLDENLAEFLRDNEFFGSSFA